MARSVREAVRWTAATQCTATAKEARPSTGNAWATVTTSHVRLRHRPPQYLAPNMRFPCKATKSRRAPGQRLSPKWPLFVQSGTSALTREERPGLPAGTYPPTARATTSRYSYRYSAAPSDGALFARVVKSRKSRSSEPARSGSSTNLMYVATTGPNVCLKSSW